MKNVVVFLVSMWIAECGLSAAVFGQSAPPPSKTNAQAAQNDSASLNQTITGRITKLDIKSGKFSVQEQGGGKIVDLVARENIVAHLRRGTRVVVTYSGTTATKVEATRSNK